MELCWKIIMAALSVLSIFLTVNASPFPCGYDYMLQAKAWFKFHTSRYSWSDANRICESEGTTLASASSDDMKDSMVLLMFENKKQAEEEAGVETLVYTSWRMQDGSYMALNESGAFKPISQYSTKNLPFICYKKFPEDPEPVKADNNSFPCGYKYMSQARAWLKIHTSNVLRKEALRTCLSEGTQLASPYTDVIKSSMLQLMKDAQNTRSVHTAWRSEENGFHIALNDTGVLESVSQGTWLLPFICYKKIETLTQDHQLKRNECGGYYYDYRTNKCYKFDLKKTIWGYADLACQKQSGRLATINSKTEAQVIRELFARYPPNKIPAKLKDIAFVGYNIKNGKWVSVTGQSLESSLSLSGYEGWAEGEPLVIPEKYEWCAAVGRNVKLYVATCGYETSFICVKKAESCQEFYSNGKPKHLCACL